MLSVFFILIAGCDHDGANCETLDQVRFETASMAACEAELDRRLIAQTAMWPVFTGRCQADQTQIAALAPQH
ncbi:MAG: hypothetical protein AAF281_01930 [Pseudomonadota bacterium]